MSEKGLNYRATCEILHERRLQQFRSLPNAAFQPVTPAERQILSYSVSEIVAKSCDGVITRDAIRQSYTKKIVDAQREFNCVSELLVIDKELHEPDEKISGGKRPLEGVPVTLKDTIDVAGHCSTIGFARNVVSPAESHSPLVRLLLDAGCIVLAKSTVPASLFSISTSSPLFSGPTLNPHNPLYGVGASTGGGAALVASGATLVEMGSDVAGSIRIPSHFAGLYGLKGSMGRWPSDRNRSSMEGIECLKTCGGPLTRSIADLLDIWGAVIGMKPWEYDSACLPIAWNEDELQRVLQRSQNDGFARKLKWGVIWTDGVIPPSPACRRALAMAIDALRDQGHDVVDVTPNTPSIPALLTIGYQLAFGDGCSQILSQLHDDGTEPLNRPLQVIIEMLKMPSWKRWLLGTLVKSLALFGVGVPKELKTKPRVEHATDGWLARILDWVFPLRHVGYSFYKAQLELLSVMKAKDMYSERALVHSRNEFRREWYDKVWKEQGVDFLLTPVLSFPAIREEGGGIGERTWPLGLDSEPQTKERRGWLSGLFGWFSGKKQKKQVVPGSGDGERAGLASAGYSFLFNILDYTAGVVPITIVDRDLDALTPPHPQAPVHEVAPRGEAYQKRLPNSVYERYGEGRIPLPDEGYPRQEPPSPTTSNSSTLVDPVDQIYDKLNLHAQKQETGNEIRPRPSTEQPYPYYASNAPSYTAYSVYDPIGMHGLPVGVQIVGRQLEEEKVLGAMKFVDDAIKRAGWSIN
ncbi:amidase signature enzyme [Marasmius fiardii PR-910]|nr:amidase signature enzyme [Marasmius fiardii PR-910]